MHSNLLAIDGHMPLDRFTLWLNAKGKDVADKLVASDGYRRSYAVAHALSGGRVDSLIGGQVVIPLLEAYRGTKAPKPSKDWDYLVERLLDPLPGLDGYTVRVNRAGFPKIIEGEVPEDVSPEELARRFTVDLTPKEGMHHVRVNDLAPNWRNFLDGNPLSSQAVLYAPGPHGFAWHPAFAQTLETGIVRVHNLDALKAYCGPRGLDPAQYARGKAAQLGLATDEEQLAALKLMPWRQRFFRGVGQHVPVLQGVLGHYDRSESPAKPL